MNRFILDLEPDQAAAFHCDKHVVKMIVEEAQMLSTVHRAYGYDGDDLYRRTHWNHPCTVWAGSSLANYRWSVRLLEALLGEYGLRYGKRHATGRLLPVLKDPPLGMPDVGLTPFPLAMPDGLKGEDPVQAYRGFYRASKAGFARWSVRGIPWWWNQ